MRTAQWKHTPDHGRLIVSREAPYIFSADSGAKGAGPYLWLTRIEGLSASEALRVCERSGWIGLDTSPGGAVATTIEANRDYVLQHPLSRSLSSNVKHALQELDQGSLDNLAQILHQVDHAERQVIATGEALRQTYQVPAAKWLPPDGPASAEWLADVRHFAQVAQPNADKEATWISAHLNLRDLQDEYIFAVWHTLHPNAEYDPGAAGLTLYDQWRDRHWQSVFSPPAEYPAAEGQVRHYLIAERGLPATIVDALRAQHQWYPAAYGPDHIPYAVFPLTRFSDGRIVGASERCAGTPEQQTAQAQYGVKRVTKGSDVRKGMYQLGHTDAPNLILVEAPLDAIAVWSRLVEHRHADLDQWQVRVTNGGALNSWHWEGAQRIYTGFDRDHQGDQYAAKVAAQALVPVKRFAPPAPHKDWADTFRHQEKEKEPSPFAHSSAPDLVRG